MFTIYNSSYLKDTHTTYLYQISDIGEIKQLQCSMFYCWGVGGGNIDHAAGACTVQLYCSRTLACKYFWCQIILSIPGWWGPLSLQYWIITVGEVWQSPGRWWWLSAKCCYYCREARVIIIFISLSNCIRHNTLQQKNYCNVNIVFLFTNFCSI